MIVPERLRPGDIIAVISPSLSLSIVIEENIAEAVKVFEEKLGLKVVFGKNALKSEQSCSSPFYNSSRIEDRIADLHWAFSDPRIKAIFSSIGGFNSHQLLSHIDYDLIRKNPKILCGYSDITAIQVAIFARTGLVTYSGPHFSTMAMRYGNEYTIENLRTILFGLGNQELSLEPSKYYSDDAWYLDQENREILAAKSWCCVQAGAAEGQLLGGNLATLRLLIGTPHWPTISGPVILFVEEDDLTGENTRYSFLQNLITLKQTCSEISVSGILVGRFMGNSKIQSAVISSIMGFAFPDVPCIGDVDFGHTNPMLTFPIACTARISSSWNGCSIIISHPDSSNYADSAP